MATVGAVDTALFSRCRKLLVLQSCKWMVLSLELQCAHGTRSCANDYKRLNSLGDCGYTFSMTRRLLHWPLKICPSIADHAWCPARSKTTLMGTLPVSSDVTALMAHPWSIALESLFPDGCGPPSGYQLACEPALYCAEPTDAVLLEYLPALVPCPPCEAQGCRLAARPGLFSLSVCRFRTGLQATSKLSVSGLMMRQHIVLHDRSTICCCLCQT